MCEHEHVSITVCVALFQCVWRLCFGNSLLTFEINGPSRKCCDYYVHSNGTASMRIKSVLLSQIANPFRSISGRLRANVLLLAEAALNERAQAEGHRHRHNAKAWKRPANNTEHPFRLSHIWIEKARSIIQKKQKQKRAIINLRNICLVCVCTRDRQQEWMASADNILCALVCLAFIFSCAPLILAPTVYIYTWLASPFCIFNYFGDCISSI